MKILLLAFNVQDSVFPLGLSYLKAYCLKHHPDVEIEIKEFSFGGRYSYDTNKQVELQALSYILLEKPDVVAFSCYIWSGQMAADFARAIKQINPNIKVVLGGVEVNETVLNKDVDFIIQGEGEIAFKELVDHLRGERALEDVHNVVCKREDKIIEGKKFEIQNLDDLPFPYKQIIKTNYAVVRLETARGCLFNCNFCHYAKPTLRHFSLEYLRENIAFLFEQYDFTFLTILDANFNTNKERMKQILDIIEQNCVKHNRKISVHMELRPELIDKALVDNLERYSFRSSVELGFQSSDEEVLKLANRPTNMNKVKVALELLNNSTIKYKIDLMYGLPGDNFFKFCKSMRFLLQYARRQNKVVAHHFMLLNNTTFSLDDSIARFSPHNSSLVVKTSTQNAVDLYKIKLFVDQVNVELKMSLVSDK